VERSTLFTVLAKMDGCSADAALAGFSRVLDRIGAQKRLSITYDRGKEMAQHGYERRIKNRPHYAARAA
jgi:IS30 family transposase